MKFLIAISFSLISLIAFADVPICQKNPDPFPKITEIETVIAKLDDYAATPADIQSAPCIKKTAPTDQEISTWIASHQSASTQSQKINGIQFENESPENLRSFELLTTSVDSVGRPDPSKQQTFTSACKNVDCAVKEIFGKSEGPQLLYMQERYGLNGSHLANTRSSSWKKDELDTVLLALTDYPDGVLPVQESRSLVHFPRGYVKTSDPYAIADATVEIFDLWNSQTPELQRYTITHELGHVIAGGTHLDGNKKWLDLSGWNLTTSVVNGNSVTDATYTKPEAIVSKYAQGNNIEDFAESVAAYRYNPAKLKAASVDKYNLIKDTVFDGVEYTSEDACQNPKRLSASIIENSLKIVDAWSPTADDLSVVSSKCSEQVVVNLSAAGSVHLNDSLIQSCYEKAFNDYAKTVMLKSADNLANREFLDPILRNIKLPPIQPERLKKMVSDATSVHLTNLRTQFIHGFMKDFFFKQIDSTQDRFKYAWEDFDKTIGFDPYFRSAEFTKISTLLSEKIVKGFGPKRDRTADFTEAEITAQVNAMIQ